MWFFFVVIAAVFLLAEGDPVGTITDMLNTIQRGKRLTRTTYGVDGRIDFEPEGLAEMAGASLDEYALARMLSSEEGNKGNLEKAAVGAVALNYARRKGRSISALLLRANNPAHSGWFGTQRDIDTNSPDFNHSDRYASTALDPYEGDLLIARGLLDGTIPDPTGGAIQFDAPPAFKSPELAERTAQNRIDEGRRQVFVDGIDPSQLRFWA